MIIAVFNRHPPDERHLRRSVEAKNAISFPSLVTDGVGLPGKLLPHSKGCVRAKLQKCPLYPQKRTLILSLRMSALCQKQTFLG